MATMDNYTIYCTPEQTKKALELNAPIKIAVMPKFLALVLDRPKIITDKEVWYLTIPTAEQLIGRLEKDYFGSIELCKYGDGSGEWGYRIFGKDMNLLLYNDSKLNQLYSRPEATLAAIDAALDYLLNNKTK